MLEFRLNGKEGDAKDLLMWIGYCAFHLENFKRAKDAYKELLGAHQAGSEIHLFFAVCHFFQQSYDEAERKALLGPDVPLKVFLLFHLAHRSSDESKLMKYHSQLKTIIKKTSCHLLPCTKYATITKR